MKSGFALSDLYCDTYFARISEHWGKRRFARNSTNDVGTLISTVLGLSAAGSGVTGGVGASFGLADALFRNYDENFLVDADLPALQKLVRSEQLKLRGELDGKMPDNYPDATMTILRYANLCSFTGMKGLLTTSMVEKTQANLTGDNALEAAIKTLDQADRIKARLTGDTDTGQVNEGEGSTRGGGETTGTVEP